MQDRPKNIIIAAVSVFFAVLVLSSLVLSQNPSPSPSPTPQKSKKSKPKLWGAVATSGDSMQGGVDVNSGSSGDQLEPPEERNKGEFVIAPIPVINPTTENGLAIGAGYLFHFDKKEQTKSPSVIGGVAFRTTNGTRGYGLGGMFRFKEDKYRLLVAGGDATINLNFFGVGIDAGNAGISIPISLKARAFVVEGLVRVYEKWYVGPRYHFLKMKAGLNFDEGESAPDDGPVIPPLEVNLRTAALGPRIKRDTSSDAFYPRNGSIFDIKVGFYGKAVGGNRTYQSYEVSYNRYFALGKKQVIAGRLASCFIRGRVPFYDLCTMGLRGYEAGRYLDRNMLAGQGEFRQELPWRLGVVGFFGIGEVAEKVSDFRSDKIRPAGGVGVRFRLTKKNHINMRLDYAWGIRSSGLYVGVTEAF